MKSSIKWTLLLSLTYISVHFLGAFEQSSDRPKLRLQELGIQKTQSLKFSSKKTMRRPAAARVFDPDSEVRPYVYAACRGPYGRSFQFGDEGYADCHNGDYPFDTHSPFSAKRMGLGIILVD